MFAMDDRSGMPSGDGERSSSSTLADKLNGLIEKRWAGRKVPGNAVIARLIREETGLPMSTGYLWMLRSGSRSNPTGPRLQALARFFGRPAAYFLDDSAPDVDDELAAALRSKDITMIALRSNGLSAERLDED
jgi:hypothetical protein